MTEINTEREGEKREKGNEKRMGDFYLNNDTDRERDRLRARKKKKKDERNE